VPGERLCELHQDGDALQQEAGAGAERVEDADCEFGGLSPRVCWGGLRWGCEEWLRSGGGTPRADVSAVGVYGGGVYDHGGVCVVFEHECGGVEEVRPGNEARFVPADSVRMLEGAGRLWRRLTKFDWLQRSRSTVQRGLVTELVLSSDGMRSFVVLQYITGDR